MAVTGERKREAQREREARKTYDSQNIQSLTPIANRERRDSAIKSFSFFCNTYFPATFTLPWTDFHRKAAEKLESAICEGGLFAFAMPRGSGKSVMTRWAVLWAVLTGRCDYAVIVGATEREGCRHIEQLKTELRVNDLLCEDFPAECEPIRYLGRSARRAEGQKYRDVPTCIEWKTNRIVLPWLEHDDSLGGGAVIEAFGLTGSIRGVSHTRPDGTTVRPTLAICDDPQTRESAKSAGQTVDRENVIVGDVAYLSGPGQAIAVVMPCTVIHEGDLADKMLNRNLHPEWQGERTALMTSFPANEGLWNEYSDLLRNSGDDGYAMKSATKFYAENREAMDAGASVSWPERFFPHELSGIQHAMNLKLRCETAFWAEYQNQPMPEVSAIELLGVDDIAAKISGFGRGKFPSACRLLTAMIDVQGSLLYWVVTAWQDDYTGYIVDYGSFPEQGRMYYTLGNASRTLAKAFPGCDQEAAIYKGLSALLATIVGRDWQRDDGATMKVARCMVDANWGNTSTLVNLCCRQSPYANVLTPSYGRGIKASHRPVSEWQQSKGARCGPEWVPTKAKGNQLIGVIYDTNYWKKRWHDSLALPLGSSGSLHLFAAPPATHRMFADHVASEVPKKTEHDTRVVYEWHQKPNSDNHLFDCAVGSMVAASLCGVTRREDTRKSVKQKKRTKVTYGE